MRTRYTFLAAAALALVAPRAAAPQDRAPADDDTPRAARPRPVATAVASAAPADMRALLGLALSFSGAERDTLGALVTAVIPDGPAERAGIDAGNRVAAINNISLRVDAESVGEGGAGDAMLRRATRALATLDPGDEVELRVFSGGRFRTVIARIAVPGRPAPPVDRPVVDEPVAPPTAASLPDGAVTAAAPTSVAAMVDAVAAVQAQLRRMEQNEGAGPTLDSLTALEQDLGAIRRRLRTLQTSSDRPATTRAAASGGDALPGISVSTVADELVPMLGEGSEAGLLVLKADPTWDPIRPGDVILRVNGSPATIASLRAARSSARASTVDLLRRKREISVVVEPADR